MTPIWPRNFFHSFPIFYSAYLPLYKFAIISPIEMRHTHCHSIIEYVKHLLIPQVRTYIVSDSFTVDEKCNSNNFSNVFSKISLYEMRNQIKGFYERQEVGGFIGRLSCNIISSIITLSLNIILRIRWEKFTSQFVLRK